MTHALDTDTWEQRENEIIAEGARLRSETLKYLRRVANGSVYGGLLDRATARHLANQLCAELETLLETKQGATDAPNGTIIRAEIERAKMDVVNFLIQQTEQTMNDETKQTEPNGNLHNYNLTHADGTPVDADGVYFVLRLDTDPNARYAANAYAECVEKGNAEFALEIRNLIHSARFQGGALYGEDALVTLREIDALVSAFQKKFEFGYVRFASARTGFAARVERCILYFENKAVDALATAKNQRDDLLTYLRALALCLQMVGNAATHAEKAARLRGALELLETTVQTLREQEFTFDRLHWNSPVYDMFRSDYPNRHYLNQIRELERENARLKALAGETPDAKKETVF